MQREGRCAENKRRYPKLAKLFDALLAMNTKAFSLPAAVKRSLSHESSKRNEIKSLLFSELLLNPELSSQRYMPELDRLLIEKKDEPTVRITTTSTVTSSTATTSLSNNTLQTSVSNSSSTSKAQSSSAPTTVTSDFSNTERQQQNIVC
jgi:hypothetical protein